MKISVLGTGTVGCVITTKLNEKGHEVMMGSRTADNEKALNWLESQNGKGRTGTFAEAAAYGEIIFNCTKGTVSLDALGLCRKADLDGKILIDLANPLHFSESGRLFLDPVNVDSLGERIQAFLPGALVVKTLNTVNCDLMVSPSLLKQKHDMFICGNDAAAKARVENILRNDFGWESVIDIGDITGARAMEMMLPLWIRLWGKFNDANFNYSIVRE